MGLDARTKITVTKLGHFDHPLAKKEAKKSIAVTDITCQPGGGTKRTDHNLPKRAEAIFLKSSVKRAEARLILGAGSLPGENLTLDRLAVEIATKFNYEPVKIRREFLPKKWFTPYPCYDVSISISIDYVLDEIDVRSATDTTIGGENYGAHEELGDLLFLVPFQIRGTLTRTHNPACCEGEADENVVTRDAVFIPHSKIEKLLEEMKKQKKKKSKVVNDSEAEEGTDAAPEDD